MMDIQNTYIGPDEAAALLGISKSTLYKKLSYKQLPYYKLAGSNFVRFKRAELIDLIEAGRVEPIQ